MLEVRSPDGTAIGCAEAGEGPPLLLVHGSANDGGRWARLMEPLGEHFRVLAMDRRGRARSLPESEPYDIDREAEDIRAVAEAVDEPVRLVAHSYGATCTLRSLETGLQVERALLYEPPFDTDELPAWPPGVIEDVEAALARADLEAALLLFLGRVIKLDAATLAAAQATPAWERRVANARWIAREARCLSAYRPDESRLADVAPRLRVLLGTATSPELDSSTRAAHAALPGSELRLLPGSGHNAMDDDPALFVAEVADWLG